MYKVQAIKNCCFFISFFLYRMTEVKSETNNCRALEKKENFIAGSHWQEQKLTVAFLQQRKRHRAWAKCKSCQRKWSSARILKCLHLISLCQRVKPEDRRADLLVCKAYETRVSCCLVSVMAHFIILAIRHTKGTDTVLNY